MIRTAVIIFLASAAYFVLQFLWRLLLVSLRSKVKTQAAAEGGAVGKGKVVQDPACGVYIPQSDAVRGRIGGEVHFYCSTECLEKHRESHHKTGGS